MGQTVHGIEPTANEALAALETKTGPSNFYRAMAHRPDVMANFPKFYGSIMGPGVVDRRIKEMVYLAVAMVNECAYCTAHHTKGARKAGVSEAEIECIQSETNQSFSAPEQAALVYARELTRTVTAETETRDKLHQFFSEDQIVELTLIVGLANFTNRFNNGLNMQVERAAAVVGTPQA